MGALLSLLATETMTHRPPGSSSAAAIATDVQPLGPADVGAAAALWEAAALTRPWNDPRADFHAALGCPTAAVLGRRDGDTLVGTVMAGFDGHRGWLYYLAVAPGRRGEGIGRALVAAAEAWLEGQGASAVRLMLRDGNEAGGFYRALGYDAQAVTVWGRPLRGG